MGESSVKSSQKSSPSEVDDDELSNGCCLGATAEIGKCVGFLTGDLTGFAAGTFLFVCFGNAGGLCTGFLANPSTCGGVALL